MGYELVTLYDVARHAGVSIATVSRVLHGQGPVRDNTRDRVRSAIDELGYVPDGAAQSLARNRKAVIGGVELRIREKNWALLINFLREEDTPSAMAQQESVQSRLLALSGKVDGLLI